MNAKYFVRDEALQHITTDIEFDDLRYCALVTKINDDGVTNELRWSSGTKEL